MLRNKSVKFKKNGQELFGKIITILADFPGYYAVFLVKTQGGEFPVLSYNAEVIS